MSAVEQAPDAGAAATARARAARPRRRLPRARPSTARCCAASRSRVERGESRTASSASRAAASRRPRSRSCATCRATAACAAGSISVAGRDVLAPRGRELRALRAERGLDGLPEPRHGAEPVDPRRPAGRRGVHACAASSAARRTSAARDDARARCRSPTPTSVMRPLPAPALGRHAAARRDRDGAGERPGAADPRRADDRPRRDGRGRGARPRRGSAQAEFDTSVLFISHNLGVIAQDVRPGRRALRRPARRGGAGRSRCSHDPRHPYTVGLLRCIPRGGVRKDHGRLDTIPGFLPQLGAELPGLRVRRPLRARRGRSAAPRSRRCTTSAAATSAAATSTSGRRSCRVTMAADARRRRAARPARATPRAARRRRWRKIFQPARPRRARARRRLGASLWPGETLGLVGESGSGKTTLARTLLGHRRADGRHRRARRAASSRRRSRKRTAEQSARAPDRLPEPRLGAQPPPHGAPHLCAAR